MSSLRPFNTSTRTPKSIKLKGFTADKNATQQLEIDSRRMEERLNELKMTMNREKQERQAQGRGNIWASGRTSGTLTAHGSELLKKGKQGPQKPSKPSDKSKVRKVKVLKDLPLDIPERPKANHGLSSGDSMPARKNFKGPACGQCEAKAVSLTCMECGENYCTTCFAKFHLKGALRNHRSVPYQSFSENSTKIARDEENNNKAIVNRRPETPKSNNGSSSHPSGGQGKVLVVQSQQNSSEGGSLLEGEYDEEQSAASFAAALTEWRNIRKQDGDENSEQSSTTPGNNATQPRPTVHDMGVGDTSVVDKNDRKVVEIKFSDSSLSYADKLLLKKHRRTEIPGLSPSPTSPRFNNHTPTTPKNGNMELVNGFDKDSKMSSEMQEEHERCISIFSGYSEPSTKKDTLGFQRLPRQLVITEIKDQFTGSQDLEVESVYSVEEATALPVTDSPRSRSAGGCEVVQITGEEEFSIEDSVQSIVERATKENLPAENREIKTGVVNKVKSSEQSESSPKVISNVPQKSPDERLISKDRGEASLNSGRGTPGGLTKAPSDGLMRLIETGIKGNERHKYSDGLEKFFKAGLGDEETEAGEISRNEPSSTGMEKCTYQGPGVWRPSSSLSVTDEGNNQVTHVPSPPKQTKGGRGSASLRRKQSGTKKGNRVDSNTISWVLSQQTSAPAQGSGADGIHGNQKRATSSGGRGSTQRAAPKDDPPRSASRIEIQGDNFSRFDDDNGDDGQNRADEETLEELTWELASQSGRISADGRISCLSLQDVDPYIKNTQFASSLDEELGIILDDGHGSGLSTPYDDITRERLSEEDMRADFESIETERDKRAVEQLDD